MGTRQLEISNCIFGLISDYEFVDGPEVSPNSLTFLSI